MSTAKRTVQTPGKPSEPTPEPAQTSADTTELDALRAENARLQAQLASQPDTSAAPKEEPRPVVGQAVLTEHGWLLG